MNRAAAGQRERWRPSIPIYLVLLVVIIGVAEGVAYVAEQRRSLERAERGSQDYLDVHASVSAGRITEALATAGSGSAAVAANTGIGAFLQPGDPPPGCSLTFTGAGPFGAGKVSLINAAGSVRCTSSESSESASHAGAPWLASALAESGVHGPYLDPTSGEETVVVTAPVGESEAGAVATFMDLADVEATLAKVSAADRPVHFVLAQPGEEPRTGDHLVSVATVDPLGWSLVATLDRDIALERAHSSNRMLLVGLVGSLAVVVVGTGLVYLGLARPIRRLSHAVRAGIGGPAPDPDLVGGPAEVARIAEDFTELQGEVTAELQRRKQAERDAAASREYYRQIFAVNPIPMWIYDADDRRILEVNEAAVAHYGYTRHQFTAMSIHELWPVAQVDGSDPADTDVARSPGAGRHRSPPPQVESGPGRHLLSDGVVIDVEIIAHPVDVADLPAFLVMAEDVTSREHARRVVERSERMESLGQLAGGIAHDFNNVLAVMLSYAEFAGAELADAAQQDPARWGPVLSDVEQIGVAGQRAATLTHQLLAFARGESAEVGPIDLNDVAREAQRMLHRTLGEQIDLEFALDDDLWPVTANPGQMAQVIVNLAVNARDAMPDGGRLLIESSNVLIGEDELARRPGLSAGPHIRLRVSDTGVGMDATTREHAFEPLFSTKGRGQGTGLGLATVYGIVRRAGGEVHLYSEPGLGTTVNVLLPAAGPGSIPVAPVVELDLATPAVAATILLVEDDDGLRVVTERILSEAGHTVLAASAGTEALALFDVSPAVDLLLTDVVMPEMPGPELAQRLTERDPGLRVLFMSGYAPPLLFADGRLPLGATLIDKPFSASALIARVRETICADFSGAAPVVVATSTPDAAGDASLSTDPAPGSQT